MCGICGLIRKDNIGDSDILGVHGMNRALYHRGPDSEGSYKDANLVLAMRRLKIIDLEGGNQPLYNEDNSLVLVANGEIYNHVELRDELEKKGHIFRTHSDCETILHLYEDLGEDCVKKLRGMFAFALYDTKNKRLLIARDRLSEKPLYYWKTEKELAFSSEMKSLLVYVREKGIELDPDAVNMFLHYQYIPESYTCVKGVNKLPPAHYIAISVRDFSFNLRKYWDMEDAKPVTGNPSELIRDAFDDLSRIIIRADVPVGISLSGGIDSAAIACFAAKHYKEHMHAFSIGYPGRPKNDERLKAKALANKLGLRFHDVELRTEDLVKLFPDLVYSMDDPIADIAAYGYYSVNRLAREHNVPVLLSGIGGDELFWGYDWVRRAVERNLIKRSIRNGETTDLEISFKNAAMNISKKEAILKPISTMKKIMANIKAERDKFRSNMDRFIFYEDLPDFMAAYDYMSYLCTDDFNGRVSDKALYSFFTSKDWDAIPIKVSKSLFHTWLYSNCVALGDRMSMASSVESRLPFLDYKFVELVIGLRKTYSDDYKLGYKKWFIDAMKGIIPEEVLKREKRGFTPPSEEWFRAIVKHYGYLCYDGYLVTNGIINKERVTGFIEKARSGSELFFAYKIVLLEVWCRRFMIGETNV